MRDAITYLCAFTAWFCRHHTGHHRLAKSKRFARSETTIARKQRAERNAMRGLST